MRDCVDMEICFEELLARVRGQVIEVINPRDPTQGPAGFRVAFPERDRIARRQLVALLLRARNAGISLEPPPVRGAMRLPVRWPTRLSTSIGEMPAAALDISEGGMFLALDRELPRDELAFQLPLDSGGPPVCGRARVVRVVDEHMAEERGLPRGYGVQIVDMPAEDRVRFYSFLERVRRRSERRIVVAASAGRAEELAACLAGAGYAVTGRTDSQALLQIVDTDPRPPDIAVIDSSLGRTREARWLRTMFESRSVPCVSAREERAEWLRAAVDRMLAVDR
jgi:hypothetical protein